MKTAKATCSKSPSRLRHSGALQAIPENGQGRRSAVKSEGAAGQHPAFDGALVEAEEEDRAGKIPPQFGSTEEFEAWRETEAYARFIGEA
jgi:hypothetical protein